MEVSNRPHPTPVRSDRPRRPRPARSMLLLLLLIGLAGADARSVDARPWDEVKAAADAGPAMPTDRQPDGPDGSRSLAALGSAFTYQGYLQSSGTPTAGPCDFRFSLWDAAGSGNPPAGGNQLGSTHEAAAVEVLEGRFTSDVDFGLGQFEDARWLEIAVRCPSGSGTYTTLAPRQALRPAPQAQFAAGAEWSGLKGMPAGFADGDDDAVAVEAGDGLAIDGGRIGIDTAGAPTGGVLSYDGASTTWLMPGSGLTLPFAGSAEALGSQPALSIENTAATGQGTAIRAVAAAPGAQVLQVWAQAGTGQAEAIRAETSSQDGTAVVGVGGHYGLSGISQKIGGAGVQGTGMGSQGRLVGVQGTSGGDEGIGVFGDATSNTGQTSGVIGHTRSDSSNASGVGGTAWSASGDVYGVWGQTLSESERSAGVRGTANASTGLAMGVYGRSSSPNGVGVMGEVLAEGGIGRGVVGKAPGPLGIGVQGSHESELGSTPGVLGITNSREQHAAGVLGTAGSASGEVYGVRGVTSSTGSGAAGVAGVAEATSGPARGVYGESASENGVGVAGIGSSSVGAPIGVYGQVTTPGGWAGYFNGDVHVNGTLSKSSGSFVIDHPLAPADRYLYHSFVESPDMKNVYDGVAVLDGEGRAWVLLPDYFEALNRDERYQLTAIGQAAPELHVAQKVAAGRFLIAGGPPGLEVNWQVTGIRQDAYAKAHPIQVEVNKPAGQRGRYLHPEAHGQPASMAIDPQAGR